MLLKILIVLSTATGGVSIILIASVVGAPLGLASASFTLTGIMKKLLSITRNKKKKHNKILMLAKSKLSSIETLVSQVLIDLDISHEEFITIFKEKDKYEKMKEIVRGVSEKEENMIMWIQRLKTKIKWKTVKKFWASYAIKKFIFFVCMYKIVDISAKTWNKAGVSVIRVHENDDVNKTHLLLLCISDIAKRMNGKNIYDPINKEIKGKYCVNKMSELKRQQITK